MNGIGFYMIILDLIGFNWTLLHPIGFIEFFRIPLVDSIGSLVFHGIWNAWLRASFVFIAYFLMFCFAPHWCWESSLSQCWRWLLPKGNFSDQVAACPKTVLVSGLLDSAQWWPFDIAWGWHGPVYSRIRRSCHRSQASDHIASPWGHKGQSHKWTHVLQMMTLPKFTLYWITWASSEREHFV